MSGTTETTPGGPPASPKPNKPRQKTEGLLERWDAALVGLVLGYACVHFINQMDYVRNLTFETIPFMHDYAWTAPAGAIVVYLAFVHGVKADSSKSENDKDDTKSAFDSVLNWLLRYWNLFLTFLSVVMLLGIGISLFKFNIRAGLFEAVCDSRGERWNGEILFYLVIFAFSKFGELFDTFFLIVRRRPVSFLHWYHHCTVLAYTWFAILVQFSPGNYFSVVNCFVHCIMYWYYYRRACGVYLSYDKFITMIQMLQMILGVIVTAVWTVLHLRDPATCPCRAPWVAIASGTVMYASYFYLFYIFFTKRYQAKGKAVAKKAE